MFHRFFHRTPRRESPCLDTGIYLDPARSAGEGRGPRPPLTISTAVSRAALVKDERNFDKFDQVFGHVFKGVELLGEMFNEAENPARLAAQRDSAATSPKRKWPNFSALDFSTS